MATASKSRRGKRVRPTIREVVVLRKDGGDIVIIDRILKDDPKSGDFSESNWYRKYGCLKRPRMSGHKKPSSYRREESTYRSPATVEQDPSTEPLAKFPTLTKKERRKLDKLHAKLKGFYNAQANWALGCGHIHEGEKEELIEYLMDDVQRAFAKYDPAHPPKDDPSKPDDVKGRPASLETFIRCSVHNALCSFIRSRKAARNGGDATFVCITNSREESGANGGTGISAESIEDTDVKRKDIAFFLADLEILREFLSADLRDVLDLLLHELSDVEIASWLDVSNSTYRRKYLAPIQLAADFFGFSPRNGHFIKEALI